MAQLKETIINGNLHLKGEGVKIYVNDTEFQGGGGSGTGVQSDWDATEASSGAIKNKPPIEKGYADNSIQQTNSIANTDNSIAIGKNNVAGAKGYYILGIEETTEENVVALVLSEQQVASAPPVDMRGDYNTSAMESVVLSSNVLPATTNAEIYIIVPNNHYTFCGTVNKVENNKLYVNNLRLINPTNQRVENIFTFNDLVKYWKDSNILSSSWSGTFADLISQGLVGDRDYMVCIPSQPTWGSCEVTISAHSEGRQSYASGDYSHAEGRQTVVGGGYGHAEGRSTVAGYGAHAEGKSTKAKGRYSHAEGNNTIASGGQSHAEGNQTEASGPVSHAEGQNTIASGLVSHAEGCMTEATYDCSHAEGEGCKALREYAHAEGYFSTASGLTSHAEGQNTIASGGQSHAEGYQTEASGSSSHAEGQGCKASGINSHAEGKSCHASGTNSHAEGQGCQANNNEAHAEGYTTIASGWTSHAEGYNTKATYDCSHAEGWGCRADGTASHAEGYKTLAIDIYSHAEGCETIARYCQHVQGKYNKVDANNTYAHILGGGTSDTARSNLHTIRWDNGQGFFKGGATTEGADYAEFFEWLDGNPDNEDRVGLLVTLDGEKIKLASAGDEVLGIISGTAAVLGDNYECEWNGKYLTDDFGRVIYDLVEEFIDEEHVELKEVEKEVIDEETKETKTVIEVEEVKTTEKKSTGFWKHPRLNPNYNPEQAYVNRADRPEWDAVGMLGKLYVRDDGTCIPNFYATIGENGVATSSLEKTNMRVLSRVNENIIRVLLK